MKNKIGPPVSGDNFRFRDKNLKKSTRYLKNNNSFLILGIRRTGKSSFLQQTALLLRNESDNNICIELDCQAFESMLDFYVALYNELPASLKKSFKRILNESKQLPKRLIDFVTDIFESVEVMGQKVDFQDKMMNYSKPFEEIITRFFSETKNVFLFLDELPFFFDNLGNDEKGVEAITQVLTNLRSWRHAGLSMGITGSLNLHQQLEHLGISRKLLAGLNTIELDPFPKEESRIFINELLKEEQINWWKPEITERLLELLPDYVPYFIQYAYNEVVVQECKTVEEVETVYYNDIMSGLFKDFIYQFDERLAIFKDEKLNEAMRILDVIAIHAPVDLNELQRHIEGHFNYEVFVKLIDYEFIRLSGLQTYTFSLNIVKNWWITKRNLNQ